MFLYFFILRITSEKWKLTLTAHFDQRSLGLEVKCGICKTASRSHNHVLAAEIFLNGDTNCRNCEFVLTSVFFITSTDHKSEEEGLKHLALSKLHWAGSKFTYSTQAKVVYKIVLEITVFAQLQKMTRDESNVFYTAWRSLNPLG